MTFVGRLVVAFSLVAQGTTVKVAIRETYANGQCAGTSTRTSPLPLDVCISYSKEFHDMRGMEEKEFDLSFKYVCDGTTFVGQIFLNANCSGDGDANEESRVGACSAAAGSSKVATCQLDYPAFQYRYFKSEEDCRAGEFVFESTVVMQTGCEAYPKGGYRKMECIDDKLVIKHYSDSSCAMTTSTFLDKVGEGQCVQLIEEMGGEPAIWMQYFGNPCKDDRFQDDNLVALAHSASGSVTSTVTGGIACLAAAASLLQS